MKNRKKQKENRRRKKQEERLNRRSETGYRDLTAYNAAERIRTGGRANIVMK